jgi:PmbA protein
MSQDLLHDVIAAARRAGADAAEAVLAERRSLSVGVRLGELEEVEREEARDLGLRVFIGRQQASVSASDISASARAKLVERAVAMARLAPEDRYAGLAPEDRLARGPFPDLDLCDPAEPAADALEAAALAAEDAARAVAGVTNSDGGSASWSSATWRFSTSGGFDGEHSATVSSLSAGVIAGEGSGMERGGEGRSQRWRADLPAPEAIGAEAGRRAVSRLGARKIASTTAPVIFENRLAGALISPLIGAISGPAIARGVSFLKDKLGQPVFGAHITLTEEPHRPRGLGSSPYDDEGVANLGRDLIDKGVLTTWLLNCASAQQLGLETTGHASRGLAGPPGVAPTNLTMAPGARDLAGLMADAKAGVLITSMFGPSLNGNTGDWSVGVSGFWFENGEIAYPVTEITVAGNLIDLYARLVQGSDLEFRGASNAPSILIDGVAIAGR